MCTSPLVGIPIVGKNTYKILSHRDALGSDYGLDKQVGGTKYDPRHILSIPCGKCKECRLHYSKIWSDRCMLELQYYNESYFVTLTYDDDHLHFADPDKKCPTLVKEDFQLFMKRLRKRCSNKYLNKERTVVNPFYSPNLRYYMCGEYGTHTRRPHYHVILFGLHLPDVVFYKRTPLGDLLYNSPFLDSVWSDKKVKIGHVVIGDVTPQSCAYVARYVTKKQGYKDNEIYERTGILPEYTSMSTHPGIGLGPDPSNFSPEIFRKGYLCLSTEDGGIKVRPNRYFERKFKEKYPDEYLVYKIHNRLRAEEAFRSESSKSYIDQLSDKAEVLEHRTSSLLRNL